MKAIRFYVGKGFKAEAFAREYLTPNYGGATVTESKGFWTDPQGQVHDEPGHVITVAIEDTINADTWAIRAARKRAYRTGEQAIMVELADGTVLFESALP